MKHLPKNQETHHISAETLLALWEEIPHLKVCYESIFARNYSEDLIRTDADLDHITVYLSRNGIRNLLPDGLFFTENQLSEEKKRGNDFKSAYNKMKKQKKEVLSFFQPYDTELFKLSIDAERKLNNLFKSGNKVLLSDSLDEPKNEYINKLIPLLPFSSQIRGNMQLIVDLLKFVFDVEKVEIKELKPLYAQFIIHKEGLMKGEYLNMNEEVKLFFDFFCHWFLPVEKKYDFRIKDFKHSFTIEKNLLLDYNTNL